MIIAHLSYGFVKLAVLQFYKRIFDVPNFVLCANIIIVFVLIFMVAATFVSQPQKVCRIMLSCTKFLRPTDPDIFCLAHPQLVDIGQDLYHQLRRIPDLICCHRSRARHRHTVSSIPGHSQPAGQSEQEVSAAGCLLVGLLVSYAADSARQLGIDVNLSCIVATSVRLYFGYKLSEDGSGRPVSDQEFSCKHQHQWPPKFLDSTAAFTDGYQTSL